MVHRRRTMLVAIVAAAICLGVSLAWNRSRNRIVVENRSGQAITSLMITTGGQSIRFAAIPSAGDAWVDFRIRGDDSFALLARLEDGTKIEGGFGYVTNGMFGERARFVIRPGGEVEFHQGSS